MHKEPQHPLPVDMMKRIGLIAFDAVALPPAARDAFIHEEVQRIADAFSAERPEVADAAREYAEHIGQNAIGLVTLMEILGTDKIAHA